MGGISERGKELKRRRHRRKKVKKFSKKLKTATASERQIVAQKVRNLTPGCDVVLKNFGLSER